MNVHLLYRDRDFDLKAVLPVNEQILTQDLELGTMFNAMALGDNFLYDVARIVILSGTQDLATIKYRQDVLLDCLNNPELIRDIYNIALEAIEARREHFFGIFNTYPSSILYSSIEMLQMLVKILMRLRKIADEHSHKFKSLGFNKFFIMLQKELDNGYFMKIREYLRELRFHNGVLISAKLGSGNVGVDYILRKEKDAKRSWLQHIFSPRIPVYTFYIADRDEAGGRALSELRSRGLNTVANALAQSADHILGFINVLRQELAFYIGCLNLSEQLARIGEPITIPHAASFEDRIFSCKGLYDLCLALTKKQKIVGNDFSADNKDIIIITGANQGGKSTLLRSIGLSQLMMQCGMFVPAESWCSSICDGIFTHYKREEDKSSKSGKFDEELGRMSEILDNIKSGSILLLNESFAATNEIEGSEIARQIITALSEKGIRIFFVTHLYQFAHDFFVEKKGNILFLRAERKSDGKRTFRILEGKPLQTSFGEDLYKRIFGSEREL